MALKLDMNKTYDRVERKFLKAMMNKMEFADEWIKTVMDCVTTISYSENANGRMREFFQPFRGLRQGDPLNPFLFLICSENSSSLMHLSVREGLLSGV